jgi:hypothetical protein
MQRELAESFAADIERNELRACADRLRGYRTLVAATHGQERELLLRQAQAAEAELRQWSELACLVKASADDGLIIAQETAVP